MDTFVAIADPTRRRILDQLALGESTVSGLVGVVGASQTAVSKHLRVLRETGLVVVRVAGPQRWYAVEPGCLRDLDVWLDRFRTLWGGKLDALERHLDQEAPR